MSLRALARAYHNNTQSVASDSGRCQLPMGVIVPYYNSSGRLEDRLRLLYHPSFRAVENEGYYEYPYNPSLTLNFVYHPARRMDVAAQRTITSCVTAVQGWAWEDVVIQEVWLAGSNELSVLNEMFHVLYAYWTETPAVGEYVGWCPFDITTDRFLVEIVNVELGGVNFSYREVRQHITQNRAQAYLTEQLTLSMRLARHAPSPDGSIAFAGL